MSLAGQGLDAFFLSFRGPDSGSNNFLFGGRRNRAPGPGYGSQLRRASRAGAQNSIQDAGALRAPAPTKDFS